jgi:hypothetical protein
LVASPSPRAVVRMPAVWFFLTPAAATQAGG